jgi:membrane-bound serine protease (ClpP class)
MPARKTSFRAGAIALALGALAVAGAAARADLARPSPVIAVVPIYGEIHGLAARSFARRLDEALAANPRFIVLDLDTWGGELEAAYEIADRVARLAPETVALVRGKAISAGALIALAARGIYMMPETRLGDCEPITVANGMLRTAPEKIVTALRSDFEQYAKRNGYPVDLAIKMVDREWEDVLEIIWEDESGARHRSFLSASAAERWSRDESKRVIETDVVVRRGQLLTMGAQKAVELGFAKLARSPEDLFRELERRANERLTAQIFGAPGWEGTVELFATPALRVALFFLAVLLIAFEITHFGAIYPGLIGMAALSLFFLGGFLMGETSPIDMGLVVVGLVFLAIEIFALPGFGIAGLIGIGCVVVGGFLSLQTFGVPRTAGELARFKWNLAMFAAGLFGTIVAFAALVRIAPASPILRGLVHAQMQRPEDGFSVASAAAVALLGRRGKAKTPLRPAGKIEVGDEQLDAVAQGEWIGAGEPVEIVDTSENRIVVRRAEGFGGGAR